jgi:hypothetical protein
MQNRHLTGSAVVHILFVLFGIWIIWMAYDLPGGGEMMPIFAASGIIIFSIAQIVKEIAFAKRQDDLVRAVPPLSFGFLKAILILVISASYFAATFYIGYFVATTLYIFVAAYALGVKRLSSIALTAVILVPLLYGFFILFLGAHLPKGFLI